MTLIDIILLLLFGYFIKSAISYFKEIKRRNLWKESIATIGVLILDNVFLFYLFDTEVVNGQAVFFNLIFTFVAFCVYWWYRFK